MMSATAFKFGKQRYGRGLTGNYSGAAGAGAQKLSAFPLPKHFFRGFKTQLLKYAQSYSKDFVVFLKTIT